MRLNILKSQDNLVLENLYDRRFRFADKEEFPITKKQTNKKRKEGRSIKYPSTEKRISKTFQIRYDKTLSLTAKFILNSFQNKYFYYAIDDILYLLKFNPIERDSLLTVLYSPVISLQNNFSINFFDIWIEQIYINEIEKVNKFLTNDSQNFEHFSYITLTLIYKTSEPVQKLKALW